LKYFLYPRVLKGLREGPIVDLGFGAGAFLKFLKARNIESFGIDSNADFVSGAMASGFSVAIDDLTRLDSIKVPILNAVCDNVLEHLELEQIQQCFAALKSKMQSGGRLVLIVPDRQGYKKDPTHCTFVDQAMIETLCEKHGLTLVEFYRYPFNSKIVGSLLYLNMQIFVVSFP